MMEHTPNKYNGCLGEEPNTLILCMHPLLELMLVLITIGWSTRLEF